MTETSKSEPDARTQITKADRIKDQWSAEVAHTRATVAGLSRRSPDDPDLLAARRAHVVAMAKDYLSRMLADNSVPRLTTEQLDDLAALFQSGAVT